MICPECAWTHDHTHGAPPLGGFLAAAARRREEERAAHQAELDAWREAKTARTATARRRTVDPTQGRLT